MEPDPIVLQDESNQGVSGPGGDLHMTSWLKVVTVGYIKANSG